MTFDKRMTAADFVGQLKDGMTIGIAGWGPRRKPMALVREILRSPLKDLTIVAYGGPDIGLLCAAGKVRKLIFGFVSLDAIPLEPWFRKARESGAIDVLELDEGMLQWGLKAAAMRLPFLPTRVGLGTDIMTHGGFKTVKSPYADGEELLAMPALRLDAALIHVSRADRFGNIQALGPDTYYDEWFARAADKAYVSAEEVVERMDESYPDPADAKTSIFERCFVTGVIPARFGAHPTSMPPAYGWDMGYFKSYAAAAGEEGGWDRLNADIAAGEEAYLERVGGEKIASLPLPIF
ncbi:acyl CoA--acetate/3-ketoacid CoA transferase subunit alpha [Sphingomonas sp. MMSM20]|uniref:CoA transferase subunit A n=1 Tax=Sphingomonas lycopersici TaxID=2951807 RepID=UPI002237F1C7|nr:CoA-transferase [Sphingomonas lycopersici]MCW6530967.1 acyl CoA--acetate/3-ketoacid CoA transferase subunit alpha [Sphingomonas lycopersici]